MRSSGFLSAIRFVTVAALATSAWACGSRTPFTIVPSYLDEDDPSDASVNDDASVRPDVSTDRAVDARIDGDVRSDGDASDARDVADRADIPDLPPCFAESREGKGIPIDFYFVVDKSNSMANDAGMKSRWSAMSNALNTFIKSPQSEGLGAGVAFFPRSSTGTNTLCNAADYSRPDVPIALLPGVAPEIGRVMAAQALGPGTPTTPAMEGTLSYAKAEKMARQTRDVAVVLVTDGQPTQCNSTLDNTATVIRNYANGSPPVRTYVLGIGPSISNLNALAIAGATAPARLIESGGEGELVAAFNAIRDNTITCDYQIPMKSGEVLDYSLVNIQVRVGVNGAVSTVRKVDNAAGCNAQGGWYYDRPVPPGNPPPTKITLCPATCDPLVVTAGSHLDMLVGCTTTQ